MPPQIAAGVLPVQPLAGAPARQAGACPDPNGFVALLADALQGAGEAAGGVAAPQPGGPAAARPAAAPDALAWAAALAAAPATPPVPGDPALPAPPVATDALEGGNPDAGTTTAEGSAQDGDPAAPETAAAEALPPLLAQPLPLPLALPLSTLPPPLVLAAATPPDGTAPDLPQLAVATPTGAETAPGSRQPVPAPGGPALPQAAPMPTPAPGRPAPRPAAGPEAARPATHRDPAPAPDRAADPAPAPSQAPPLAQPAPAQPPAERQAAERIADLSAAPPPPAPEARAPAPPPAPAAVPLPPRLAAEAGHQLVLRVARAAEQRIETISVDLRPPELGRVEVRLSFRDGAVHQVVVAAERPETLQSFVQDRGQIEQQLQRAGIDLGAGGLELRQGMSGGQDGGRWSEAPRPTPPAHGASDSVADAEIAAPAAHRGRALDSLVDIIA